MPQSPKPKPAQPEIVRDVAALRARVAAWRGAAESVALVPTMGALHAGHLALVREAGARCRRVIVTIFVNPAQFGPDEDLGSYPRDEAADVAELAALGVDLVFAPPLEVMYPAVFATGVSVGGVTSGLCGDHRPGHFDGVATVVTKLLLQALPDVALFGEKDYQQLLTIRALVRDLDVPVEIAAVATVRDEDGMALSSRNAYLSPAQRQIALILGRVLFDVAETLARGESTVAAEQARGLAALEAAGFDAVDYLEVRDAETLAPIATLERPARVLAAVHLGPTRLIDNVAVEPPAG
jgi:pantoate--beta-alanine ligase